MGFGARDDYRSTDSVARRTVTGRRVGRGRLVLPGDARGLRLSHDRTRAPGAIHVDTILRAHRCVTLPTNCAPTKSGPDADGYERFMCPALRGHVRRCAANPASPSLALVWREQNPQPTAQMPPLLLFTAGPSPSRPTRPRATLKASALWFRGAGHAITLDAAQHHRRYGNGLREGSRDESVSSPTSWHVVERAASPPRASSPSRRHRAGGDLDAISILTIISSIHRDELEA